MLRAMWMTVVACGIYCVLSLPQARAQEKPAAEAPETKPRPGALNLSTWLELGSAKAGELAQSASDLRKSAEAIQQTVALLERIMPTLGPVILGTTENMSRLSSEFDPFGYKTAFRTVQVQNEIIERQQQLIQKLQQDEINRLQGELQAVKKKGKPRKKRSPATQPSE
jgi:hypothetical protein